MVWPVLYQDNVDSNLGTTGDHVILCVEAAHDIWSLPKCEQQHSFQSGWFMRVLSDCMLLRTCA